mmetsp:Transcript_21057/g.49836  ORF Transcript_21057/g.49836 Transcript_21057/m.49836 type:complete len:230 (+) Transcript_21057:298-987(+)
MRRSREPLLSACLRKLVFSVLAVAVIGPASTLSDMRTMMMSGSAGSAFQSIATWSLRTTHSKSFRAWTMSKMTASSQLIGSRCTDAFACFDCVDFVVAIELNFLFFIAERLIFTLMLMVDTPTPPGFLKLVALCMEPVRLTRSGPLGCVVSLPAPSVPPRSKSREAATGIPSLPRELCGISKSCFLDDAITAAPFASKACFARIFSSLAAAISRAVGIWTLRLPGGPRT